MEGLPQRYRVSTRECVSVVGNVAGTRSLIPLRRGMERRQSAAGWLRRIRRGRLMFLTWKTRFVRDRVGERKKAYHHTYDRCRCTCQLPRIGDGRVLTT